MDHKSLAATAETRHYINGQWSESSDKGTYILTSPYTLEAIANISEATIEDVNRAVAAAKSAFPAWAALSPVERGVYLHRLSLLVSANLTDLAQLDAISMGRPVAANFDVSSIFAYYAQAGYHARGETSLNSPGFANMTFRQPLGPVAVIIPWNVPALMWAKIAPALAAGCTVVVKSSEKAPLVVSLSTA
jgi:aldehyde dehydrogenase (NAD+)